MTTKNRARSGFGLGVTLALMAACGGGGGGGEGGGGSSLAACAPGQTTACICPDGRELAGSCDPFDGVPCGCESGDSDGGGRDATGQNDRGPSPGDGSVPPVDGLEPLTDAPAAEDTTPLTDQGAPADAGPDGVPPPHRLRLWRPLRTHRDLRRLVEHLRRGSGALQRLDELRTGRAM